MLTEQEVAQLTSKRRIPWLKLIKAGIDIKQLRLDAQKKGNYMLAEKANTALFNYRHILSPK